MNMLISVVIPVFNEEWNIPIISNSIASLFNAIPYDYEILFVNDGSTDNSLQALKTVASENKHIKYISFSRNFGKDNALLAGFDFAKGDAVITMDADMQHPPELIPKLIDLWQQGNAVVYTYREDKNEHAAKMNQLSSTFFYRLINHLSDVELEDGIADYRLLDKKVVAILNNLHEDRPFFRGLVKWVGFQQTGIPYKPHARATGETKYDHKALVRLALQGLTSFSVKPLNIAIYLGFSFSALSVCYLPYVLYSLLYGKAISGWASTIVTIVFFGGLQLMILGIMGIYLGKLFMQSKQRPKYIIDETNIQ
ncbi:dolichol-phosphate mannosyltransferase [Hydrotalea sandarakina]|jgi:dolichol-phosphate mannosyltransferase|uniref:Dolichol-phosphate mannosyltransferase n=2 Tax=Hydrotalea sandarakina TaxID=1004304 RepID=A0A2W7RY32_9BACT|nr:dolichol-phosphate mannosyltransferase [Hydrotalea sandarakina]